MNLHDIVKKGSTDRSVALRIIDATDGTPETGVVFNTSGIDLWYRREGAAVTSITEATLSALTDIHSDGGFLHISDGEYRLDLPDAAFATGAEYVDFGGTVTGMIVLGGRVRLVDIDLEDAVRGGLTALPSAAADAAGGLPISDAGGLDMDAIAKAGDNMGAVSSVTGNVGGSVASVTAAVTTDAASRTASQADVSSLATQASVDTNTTHLTDIKGTGFIKDTHSLEDIQAFSAAILGDTNELQTDWADGGRLDLLLDDVPTTSEFVARTLAAADYFDPAADTVANVATVATTTTNTDMRGTDNAALASVATEARLSELDAATAGKMANQVDVIQTDTTTDIPGLISGQNDISVADVLTTQMTEAYAADGSAPTLAQALFLIQQSLGDFTISGTTVTVKKLDGTTTAATFTLDDGSSPTGSTRAS